MSEEQKPLDLDEIREYCRKATPSLQYLHGRYVDLIPGLVDELQATRERIAELDRIVSQICPHCGGRMDVQPTHIERCFCLPVIRDRDQRIAELKRERDEVREHSSKRVAALNGFLEERNAAEGKLAAPELLLAQVREMAEKEPHQASCYQTVTVSDEYGIRRIPVGPCNCWKSRILALLDAPPETGQQPERREE